jgi:hypothetical protein
VSVCASKVQCGRYVPAIASVEPTLFSAPGANQRDLTHFTKASLAARLSTANGTTASGEMRPGGLLTATSTPPQNWQAPASMSDSVDAPQPRHVSTCLPMVATGFGAA